MTEPGGFEVLQPSLQVSFYYRLQALRDRYLHEALRATVARMDLVRLDGELSHLVDGRLLAEVASLSLRGETVFPVPCILEENPYLLGYYRLLYGLSQKEFYNKGPYGMFARLEETGQIAEKTRPRIPALCQALVRTGEMLVDGISDLSLQGIHELQLLTVGAYLRGSENTRIGQNATAEVFALIRAIVGDSAKQVTHRVLRVENAVGSTVLIEFSSDPDISITEIMPSGVRPLVSIEIKGGTDASNIHNRLGEAEKSHQKARSEGFREFWTIVRVNVDRADAQRETPTTVHFFHMDSIQTSGHPEHGQFRDLLCSVIGIPKGVA